MRVCFARQPWQACGDSKRLFESKRQIATSQLLPACHRQHRTTLSEPVISAGRKSDFKNC